MKIKYISVHQKYENWEYKPQMNISASITDEKISSIYKNISPKFMEKK